MWGLETMRELLSFAPRCEVSGTFEVEAGVT